MIVRADGNTTSSAGSNATDTVPSPSPPAAGGGGSGCDWRECDGAYGGRACVSGL